LVLSLVWVVWPEIDLWASGYFYAESCNCFPVSREERFAVLRDIDSAVAWAGRLAIPFLFLSALGVTVWRALQGTPWDWRRLWRNCSFMLVLGLITPLFLIHEVLKKEIGRPRPREVSAFAGDKVFTPPWESSLGQCSRNCSFPSGHVAFPAWLMSAWYLGGRHRRLWLIGGALGCLGVALIRIALGAHFLSDTLASVALVWLSGWLLARIPWWRNAGPQA
jgi:membrane-associated phospholipid phosphatase